MIENEIDKMMYYNYPVLVASIGKGEIYEGSSVLSAGIKKGAQVDKYVNGLADMDLFNTGGDLRKAGLALDVLGRMNMVESCWALLNRLTESETDNPDAVIPMATFLILQKKWEQAGELLEPLREDYPSNINILNRLGVIYGKTKKNEKSYEVLKQALEIDTGNQGLLLNVAIACWKTKRLDESAAYLEQLLKTSPENSQAHYLLGIVYAHSDTTLAFRHLKKAASIDPSLAEEIKNKFMLSN